MSSGRFSANTIAGALAVVITLAVFAALEWKAARTAMAAGFWFEDAAFDLPPDVAGKLGGALTAADIHTIKQLSRRELEQAFAGLQIVFPDDGSGFWRVQVVSTLRFRGRVAPFGAAGASFGFGPLGGRASIGLSILAVNALRHAPANASRQAIIEGIGRGVGRAAVHEFAHQIAGAQVDDRTHQDSYEDHSADRAPQDDGELRWARVWPILRAKVGVSSSAPPAAGSVSARASCRPRRRRARSRSGSRWRSRVPNSFVSLPARPNFPDDASVELQLVDLAVVVDVVGRIRVGAVEILMRPW